MQRCRQEVDLDDMRKWNERVDALAQNEVVQGDHVPLFIERLARFYDFGCRLDVLQYLDHDLILRQVHRGLAKKQGPGEVDERPFPFGERIYAEKVKTVHDVGRGVIGIVAGKKWLDSIAEEQLVPEYLRPLVEYGLSCDEFVQVIYFVI